MKKWRCTVCGYIHEGEEPPEKCPVCGAGADKFEEVVEEQDAEAQSPESESPEAPEKTEADEDASQDETEDSDVESESAPASAQSLEAEEAEPQAAEGGTFPQKQGFVEKYDPYLSLITKLHGHPISVHFPNGVVPLAVIFMFLAIFFKSESLSVAYLYNMIAVLLSMPVVLFTGYVDWKRVYGGAMTSVFLSKMVCGGIISGAAFIAVIWRAFNPEVLSPDYSGRLIFIILNLVMLGAAGFAGYQGGKLVFRD